MTKKQEIICLIIAIVIQTLGWYFFGVPVDDGFGFRSRP